jgi:streptomycin 6-kinase
MFNAAQTKALMKNWGEGVYTKILRECELYSNMWSLSDLEFVEHYSMNAIFYCKSKPFGDCVLKIGCGFQNDEFVSEYNVLREYNGGRYVKILKSDVNIETNKRAMLIERVFPGTMLRDVDSLDKRLAVFSMLYDGLHIKPSNMSLYKKYIGKVNDYADYIYKRNDCGELSRHMAKAREICAELSAVYNKDMLLHGDLHADNILLKTGGEYVIIDPQGLVGDPIFDIPRFILAENYNMRKKASGDRIKTINHIIDYFENSLNIPKNIIKHCFYVEIVLFECWCASVGDYGMDNVVFAYNLLSLT